MTVSQRRFDVLDTLAKLNKPGLIKVDGYYVKTTSQRYQLFAQNQTCVSCGLTGTVFLLQRMSDPTARPDRAHFNLYAQVYDALVLMTKDHIIPRSKGGKDVLENYQTMCVLCNSAKGCSITTSSGDTT